MPNGFDHELKAMSVLVPFLAPIVGEPERVDGGNPAHPGQTFDFALRRPNGVLVAVEITRLMDEDFVRLHPVWRRVAGRIEDRVRAVLADPRGTVVLGVSQRERPEVTNAMTELLARAVVERIGGELLLQTPPGVSIGYTPGDQAFSVGLFTVGGGLWEGGSESQSRLRDTISSNTPKLAAAGRAGYETHLAVIGFLSDDMTWWRECLRDPPPLPAHPEMIWGIDTTPNPWSVVRVYP